MKELNFGVLGAGRFGRHYIRLLQKTNGAKLSAIAAKTAQTFEKIKISIPKKTLLSTDPNAVIESNTVDCLIIATPLSTHFDLALKAIKAGKHVLLEKPMAQNLEQAKKIKKALKGKHQVFMVGHQYVYNDYINYIKAANGKNFFGCTKFVMAEHTYFGPIREDVGSFWDAGTHQLSVIQHIFSPGKITDVSGDFADLTCRGFDDFASATIKFQNGLTANLLVSCFSHDKSRKYAIIGEDGSAIFDDFRKKNKLKMFESKFPKNSIREFNEKILQNQNTKPFVPKIIEHEPLQNQLNHFIDCVQKGKKPKTNIDESIIVTTWLEKISKKIGLPG